MDNDLNSMNAMQHYAKEKYFFWDDVGVKKPSVNLAINKLCVDLIQEQKYDVIARVYSHSPGIILGHNQNSSDINLDFCTAQNYEVISRPTGGSAVFVDPNITLCFSVFFKYESNKELFSIHETYKKIIEPLAKNLGNKFSIEGNYYIRYGQENKKTPIIGHAMKSYGSIVQCDGLVQLQAFDMNILKQSFVLRDLLSDDFQKYICANNIVYDLKGKIFSGDTSSLRLLRSEKKELESIVGLEDIGISIPQFKAVLKKSLEESFNANFTSEQLNLSVLQLKQHLSEIGLNTYEKNKKHLGHCFVDFMDLETKNDE